MNVKGFYVILCIHSYAINQDERCWQIFTVKAIKISFRLNLYTSFIRRKSLKCLENRTAFSSHRSHPSILTIHTFQDRHVVRVLKGSKRTVKGCTDTHNAFLSSTKLSQLFKKIYAKAARKLKHLKNKTANERASKRPSE